MNHFFKDLANRKVSRRDFLKFCSAMAATLALPAALAPRIAHALTKEKPHLVWLEYQDCAGDTEAFLRFSKPTAAEAILDVFNVDYHETIMAPSGKHAEKSLGDVIKKHRGKYFAVVEGSIPMADDGIYCCVGGRTALERVRTVCRNALATIAVGTCAAYGGLPQGRPHPTGAVGVADAVPGIRVVNLPGCPANAENIAATIVYILTFGALPPLDSLGRPLFAYGKRIHDNCERRAHFDAGQYVRQWGDDGHRAGWCLYHMGCKGPQSSHNCPTVKYNEGTSWPVQSGHGCIGCAEPNFWDEMTPFYRRLPQPYGLSVETTADKVGFAVTAGTVGGILAHALTREAVKRSRRRQGSSGKTGKKEE